MWKPGNGFYGAGMGNYLRDDLIDLYLGGD